MALPKEVEILIAKAGKAPKTGFSTEYFKYIKAIADRIKDPQAKADFTKLAFKNMDAAVQKLRAANEKKGGSNIFGKIGSGIKNIGKGIAKGIGNIGKGIGNVGGAIGSGAGTLAQGIAKGVKAGVMFGVNIIGNVALLPLSPFIPAMKKEIRAKGKKPKNDLLGIAKQFRSEVLSKESFDCFDGNTLNADRFEKYYLDPLSVGSLVALIKKYFDKIKSKAAAGEPLTPKEQTILNTVNEAEQQIKDGVASEVDQRTGNFLRENWKPIAIVGGSLVGLSLMYIGVVAARKRKQGE